MKVYIASNFADKDRVKARSDELAALGITCTSRWALETVPHNCKTTDGKADYLRETAVFDLEDILASDKLVLTVPSPEELMNLTPHQMSRGGRTFESGLMYGLIYAQWQFAGQEAYEQWCLNTGARTKAELIIMGAAENVFHFLDGIGVASKYPTVVVLPDWDAVRAYLIAEANAADNRRADAEEKVNA